MREVLSDKIQDNARKSPVPRSKNIYDVSGLYPSQQSLVIGSYVKKMVCEVLSDSYRITQDKSQYQ